jgi:hypothetical protein
LGILGFELKYATAVTIARAIKIVQADAILGIWRSWSRPFGFKVAYFRGNGGPHAGRPIVRFEPPHGTSHRSRPGGVRTGFYQSFKLSPVIVPENPRSNQSLEMIHRRSQCSFIQQRFSSASDQENKRPTTIAIAREDNESIFCGQN